MITAEKMRPGVAAVLGALVAGSVLLLPPAAAYGSTITESDTQRAAKVQLVLDRVLGPGNSTVVMSETMRSSATTATSVRWGSGVPQTVSSAVTRVGARAGQVSTSRQNLVGGTTTTTSTPPGALLRQSVTVVIDSRHLGTRSIAAVRRLVAAATGTNASRGDRLSVVAVPFPGGTTAPTPRIPGWMTVLLPYGPAVLWGLGAVAAVGVLLAATRRRRPE